jgi:2-polyprenyl-3-methyl-5-hydroxy-6-metoxy-1,4-benzoquinol methylase
MTGETEFFLPPGYRTNVPASADRDGTPYWEHGLDHNDIRYQVPVYRLAATRARRLSPKLVMDIGCGSGDKLAEFFGTTPARAVGVDQESAISLAKKRFTGIEWLSGDLDSEQFWTDLTAYTPDLVICSDVIEHLVDPCGLLRRLHRLTGDGLLILSTPDRSRFDPASLGPPGNPRHIREWAAEELAKLVEASNFKIVAQHHLLPRRYSWTMAELERLLGRARRGMAIPDRRTCQVYELRCA